MSQALAALTGRRYREAEELFRAALELDPACFDTLHMLGVACLQQDRAEEGASSLMAALPHMTADYPPFFTNLGLCLAAVAAARGVVRPKTDAERQGGAYSGFFRRGNLPSTPPDAPLVSIVAPCYNHEKFVADAIASVSRQTYSNIELIVIDDGSKDGSAAAISQALATCPFRHRFVRRENRGAHATLNEGIESASGKYIGIINTDDLFTPERVELMVRMLVGSGASWGFSNVTYVDGESRTIRYGEQPRVDSLMKYHDALYRCHAVSEDFRTHNHAISTGNLFFERGLWQRVGGFEALRYNHDWAFCLAAVLEAEPAYLDEPTYLYRLHGANTIRESAESARRETDSMLARWHSRIAAAAPISNQTFVRLMQHQREADFATMAAGAGHVLDRGSMLRYARELGFGQRDSAC